MISDVVISGNLSDRNPIDERFVDLETISIDGLSGKEIINKIPLLYWTRDVNNSLTRLKSGIFLVIRGRIEREEKIGLYILVEQFQSGN